jgi:hypothetical protein
VASFVLREFVERFAKTRLVGLAHLA